MRHHPDTQTSARDPAASRAKWVFVGFAMLGGVLLAIEHRAHLLGFLPWLILLACPLMHLFMHHGHGHGGGDHGQHGGGRGGEPK